jgi:MFS family permease
MKKDLTSGDYKVIAISSIGGILEFYDFIIFALFASILSHLFFAKGMSPLISMMAVWSIFAAGYLVRPIGGIILAHFGDKYGRKKIFSLTIFLMAVSTFVIGLLPTYASIGITAPILLLIFRLCQGLAIGGEIPGSATFVYEHIPKERAMTGQACLYAGLVGGILAGSVIGTILTHSLSHGALFSWGWRVPFFIGGILGILGVYLRKRVSETPVFQEMLKHREQVKLPIKELLKKSKAPTVAGFFLVAVVAITVVNFFLYMAPHLIKILHYSLGEAFTLNSVGLAIAVFFIAYTGIWADKYHWNPKKIIIIASIAFLLFGVPSYHIAESHNLFMLSIMYIIFGISFGLFVGAFSYMMAKSFKPNIRFSGYSVSYNLAFAIFGGLTPVFNTLLIDVTGSMAAPGYLILVAGLVGLITVVYYKKDDVEI